MRCVVATLPQPTSNCSPNDVPSTPTWRGSCSAPNAMPTTFSLPYSTTPPLTKLSTTAWKRRIGKTTMMEVHPTQPPKQKAALRPMVMQANPWPKAKAGKPPMGAQQSHLPLTMTPNRKARLFLPKQTAYCPLQTLRTKAGNPQKARTCRRTKRLQPPTQKKSSPAKGAGISAD